MDEVLRVVLELIGLALYIGLWGFFVIRTLIAPQNQPPSFNPVLVGFANGLAGLFGAAFAIALGIDSTEDPNESLRGPFDVADVLTTEWWSENISAVCVVLYLLVGVAVLLTYLFRSDRSPELIKNIAVIFVGYVLSILAIALNVQDKLA